MKRGSKSLIISLSFSQKLLTQSKSSAPIKSLPILRPLSSTTKSTNTTRTQSAKDQSSGEPSKESLILEKFRQRKLQGSSKPSTQKQEATLPSDVLEVTASKGQAFSENHEVRSEPTTVVSCFAELGLREEVIVAAGEMGVWVPSEIQCVGIPAVLEGKSVVLSSDSGSGRTLAYLLPLIQLLRHDGELSSMKPDHPRAIVLCTTEEQSEEGFRIAKFISDFASKSRSGQLHPQNVCEIPIGLLIGTPGEVLQQIEERSIFTDDVKYLVLDNADSMFDRGFGPEISKIISPSENHKLKLINCGLQTVMVTSTITKILGNKLSPIMESLEHDNAGKVTATLLELDRLMYLTFLSVQMLLLRKWLRLWIPWHLDLELKALYTATDQNLNPLRRAVMITESWDAGSDFEACGSWVAQC